MSPVVIGNATLYLGDCLEQLRAMPASSAQCCVTSPPYYGLRDYGHPDQIGLESTPDDYVARLVAVFAEVRRVLTDDGTCWVNLGDSYASNPASGGIRTPRPGIAGVPGEHRRTPARGWTRPPNLKPKDLIGIPWRVAFALQEAGWYLRQDIIWAKPNPMPESVTDRCTKAHEYLFLLSKSARYYFDGEAIKELAANRSPGNIMHKYADAYTASETEEHRTKAGLVNVGPKQTRNHRSVWTIASQPYSGAHFAVTPPALVEPCVLAGSRPDDLVLDPFGGSGTVGAVALRHGRRAALIELNPAYQSLIVERLTEAKAQPDMFVTLAPRPIPQQNSLLEVFA